jgi:hypothetical protein
MRLPQRCAIPTLALLALPCLPQANTPVSLQQNGWSIECSVASDSLLISESELGVVLRDIHLSLDLPSGSRRLSHFSAHVQGNHELLIETTEPKTAWVFDLRPDKLVVSTTTFHGVLSGSATTPSGRIISRLLDPEGLTVRWEGTGENAETFGGIHQYKESHLPRRHPEVTYLSLGHVSAAGLHSLFDQATDTAIDFGEGANLANIAGDNSAFSLTLPVADNASITLIPNYYTKTLGLPFYVRFDDSRFHSAPMVWSSWTSYYEAVTEKDVVQNADWLASNLKQYGFQYVQLDDGYDRRPEGHSWIENWNADRFPHGPEWLTSHIHADGLKAGIWLVPNAYAPALKDHPDWYLYDKQGKVLLDYATPALDSTNPQVLKFERQLFAKLDSDGFDYFKFDGESALPAYAPPIDKTRLHTPQADFIQNYRERLKLIRNTIGPDRFIEVCPTGVPLDGIGFANSYFNGDDLYNNWQGMHSFFSGVLSNLFLNHVVSYVMPGEGLELGEPMTVEEAATKRPKPTIETERIREDPMTGFGTTIAEARTLVTYVALTGVAYPLASVMPELPAERVDLLRATMPTLPIYPIDLFSRGTESSWLKFRTQRLDTYIHHYPELLDLKVNASGGIYDVAAETNWRSEATERTLDSVDQLGLPRGQRYVVFDFWKQRPVGVFNEKLDLQIDPHDTVVLLIHRLLDRPQLIANSRHISGSYSVVRQEWDEARKELHGQSTPIAGKPYTLWFHTPAKKSNVTVRVLSESGKEVPFHWQQDGEFASLTFTGLDEPENWSIRF